jgi:CheY-like chemotaxis protein
MRSPDYGGKGIVETFRTTFLSKSGQQIPVAISGTILYDDRGNEDGTIGFAKDLREILLKDQLATLGEVAVGLSHEINNPLAVILNQAELLQRDINRLAGERDVSVEEERLDAVRREISRISEILMRLDEMVREESYETINYVGPTRMIDLRAKRGRKRVAEQELQGARVLVVDDDLGICRSLREILESDGCQVEVAGDGIAALAALNRLSFDVVLTDVVMPQMDGYELYTAIQQRRPNLPVLMMTAFHYDKDHIIKRSRMAGLETVIFKKPVDPDRLRRTLIDAVGERKRDA